MRTIKKKRQASFFSLSSTAWKLQAQNCCWLQAQNCLFMAHITYNWKYPSHIEWRIMKMVLTLKISRLNILEMVGE